ncbi:MAG: multidrug transporter [Chloroflexota bacterium]
MTSRKTKLILAALTSVALAALVVWVLVENRKNSTQENTEERAKPPARLYTQDGERLITLDRTAQVNGGITVARLEPTLHRDELRAYGSVLQIQELVDLYDKYVTAREQVEKARASIEASRKEYERLKPLRDNRNISDKNFQAAEAAWLSDEASARAAQQSQLILEGNLRQRWGPVLAKWLEEQSPVMARLIRQEDVLVQVTLSPEEHVPLAPTSILLQTSGGRLRSAKLVSPSPHTDPRIQGSSFFYLAEAREPGLVPGINVVALLPVGSQVKGVIVPSSAVVWWQGKPWVYLQKDQDHFIRKEISTELAVKEGWFVSKNLAAADRIVIGAAQLVLSEELRVQIPGEE